MQSRTALHSLTRIRTHESRTACSACASRPTNLHAYLACSSKAHQANAEKSQSPARVCHVTGPTVADGHRARRRRRAVRESTRRPVGLWGQTEEGGWVRISIGGLLWPVRGIQHIHKVWVHWGFHYLFYSFMLFFLPRMNDGCLNKNESIW